MSEMKSIMKNWGKRTLFENNSFQDIETALSNVKKLKSDIDKENEKNPNLAKITAGALASLLAASVITAVTAITDTDSPTEAIPMLAHEVAEISPDLGQQLEQLGQNYSKENVMKFISGQQNIIKQSRKQLASIDK